MFPKGLILGGLGCIRLFCGVDLIWYRSVLFCEMGNDLGSRKKISLF